MGITRGPTTLDGLVAALSEQKGWADVTAPSDISIDGYAGKAFQRTAPADMSDCDTMGYRETSRIEDAAPRRSEAGRTQTIHDGSAAGRYEPGQIETLWVLDIDGTVVVISTRPCAGAIGGGSRRFRRRRARLDPHRAGMSDVRTAAPDR